MDALDDIRQAKEIIQALLKAKKTIRMYPENNPIYIKTLDDTFSKFDDFFDLRDEFSLKIRQYEILFDSEQIYHNPEKEDNLALFFFKDGLRELKFKKGLTKEELEEFLKIMVVDFDREFVDDDIVTLLWEKDFQNIKYSADEAFLTDDADYEAEALRQIGEDAPKPDELLKAYSDAFIAEDISDISIVNLTDRDLNMLVKEIDRDTEDKAGKLTEILFEMLPYTDNKPEYEDICRFIKEIIIYSIKHKDLKTFLSIIRRVSATTKNTAVNNSIKNQLSLMLATVNTEETIRYIGEILDSDTEISDALLNEYIELLDRNAINPFISIMGELKSIRGRKNVITILIQLGSKDIQTLAKGLHDSRWYVVRNIIYILRNIGDKRAVEYLLNTAKHSDIRVRKEAIKALGELKSPIGLQTLRDALNDADDSVRRSAAKALGAIGSETARRLIIEKISQNDFNNRDFEEKKEFYEVLSRWNDAGMIDFLTRKIKKRSLFKRAQRDENNACAAYCLGLMGSKEALPDLYNLRGSKNKLLRDHVDAAIKRIEYGE